METSAASRGHRWALVAVVSIKDAEMRHTRVPMPVRRRSLVGPMGADPLCAYDALRAAWLAREVGVPSASAGRAAGRRSSRTRMVACHGRQRRRLAGGKEDGGGGGRGADPLRQQVLADRRCHRPPRQAGRRSIQARAARPPAGRVGGRWQREEHRPGGARRGLEPARALPLKAGGTPRRPGRGWSSGRWGD
eukprot:5817589-Pleurochrysis_carterae.AAC.1